MRLASVLLLLPLMVNAQDAERGKDLYDTYCGGCHYERVHDRLRTDVRDLDDLRTVVTRWTPYTKRPYTADDIADIVQYLNESHYRFGLPARKR